MSDLKTNLQLILNEKQQKILPENIKKDVTMFNVIGTYEGSGGGTLNNQDKEITENGTYTADEGYTGLGTVTVNVPQEGGGTVEGIKQFSTEEEMNADTTSTEGDLAVVYSSTISNITADSQFQTAKVPSTVVLPEAFTNAIEVRFQAVDSSQMFDCWGNLDSSMFTMDCNSGAGSVRIEYTSSDGITYTRTDGGEESVDFGAVIQFGGTWNDVIGYFIQSSSNYFGGLFKHKLIQDTSKINFISNVKLNNTITYDIVTDDYLTITEGLRIVEAITEHFGKIGHMTIIKQNNIITAYIHAIATGALTIDDIMLYNNKIYVGLYTTAIGNMTGSYKIIFSEDLSTYTVEDLTATQLSGNYYAYEEIPVNSKITGLESNGKYHRGLDFYDVSTATRTNINFGFGKKGVYEVVSTQLSADSDYVYEKEFYGKNGVETGSLQNSQANNSTQLKMKIELWSIFNEVTFEMTDLSNCFSGTSIKTIPLLDTSAVTTMNGMFSGCTELETIPLLNTSNVTSMSVMFNGCSSLKVCPILDTSKVTNFSQMFGNCTSLETAPLLDTSKATTLNSMFSGCSTITEIPQYNTSKVVYMQNTFSGCTALVTVPILDTSAINGQYGWYDTFKNCPNLSDESLNNILRMCANATSFTGTKTLANMGLTSAQATKCTTLSNYSAFTAAGWKTGY